MAFQRLHEFQYPKLCPDEIHESNIMTNIVRSSYYSYFKNLLVENYLNHSKGVSLQNEIFYYANEIELAALVKSINVDTYRSEMLKNIKTIEQFNSNEISYKEISVKEWIMTNNIDSSSDSSDNEAVNYIKRLKSSNTITGTGNNGRFTWTENTKDLASGSNSGYFARDGIIGHFATGSNTGNCSAEGNTGLIAGGGNTENLVRQTNTGHFDTGSDTGLFARGGNTEKFTRFGNTGQIATGGNTGQLATGGNTGLRATGDYTGLFATGGNKVHFARAGNREHLARRGISEHFTSVTPMETNEITEKTMEPFDHKTTNESTLSNNAPISNDPIYQELEKIFYNEDNNSENSPSLEVSTVMNNSKIWICEYKIYKFFFMQQMSAIYIMNPDKYDRIAEKINIMFGTEDDSPQSSISLEEVVKMTKFRIAHYVTGFLSPFYKEKKLKSVQDFRILAKGIVEELIHLDPRIEWAPIECGIKKTFIEKYNYIKKHQIKKCVPLFVKNIFDFHKKKIKHL